MATPRMIAASGFTVMASNAIAKPLNASSDMQLLHIFRRVAMYAHRLFKYGRCHLFNCTFRYYVRRSLQRSLNDGDAASKLSFDKTKLMPTTSTAKQREAFSS